MFQLTDFVIIILLINILVADRVENVKIIGNNITKDEITLPDPYENASLTLVGPKAELSFTKNVYFTTFIQYNTQMENVNFNTRFQWRFKPMSDFYIVYTENYLTPRYGIKNRALVLKFIYWLNV